MRVNRRRILGTVASAALLSRRLGHAAAQSTPVAATGAVPGYAIARFRALPTPELAAAIVADVLTTRRWSSSMWSAGR
jgi:hypothetical protein